MTALVLAIDAGGTGTRARLTDGTGRVLSVAEGGPGATGLGAAGRDEVLCVARAALGGTSADGLRIGAGIAGGAFRPAELERTRAALGALGAEVRAADDAETACLGAHGAGAREARGGIVIVGTGSAAFGWGAPGPVRAGGWGFPVSDEGSGARIGLAAARHALRASDGRVPVDGLSAGVLGAIGADPVAWQDAATPGAYAALAPLVIGAAEAGEAPARDILEDAAAALSELIAALRAGGVRRVAAMGGLAGVLAARLPKGTVLVPPQGDALDGAALLVRDTPSAPRHRPAGATRRIVHRARGVFDGARLRSGVAVLVEDGRVAGIGPPEDMPGRAERRDHGERVLAPGLVDWQVNGGGGTLLNDDPTPEGIAGIVAAHAALGTSALMPTLVTDRPDTMDAVAEAVAASRTGGLAGVAGLHLEGPHLAAARAGAHDAGLFRPVEARDLERAARPGLGRVLVTLAPEVAGAGAVAAMRRAGAVVSLGHSDVGHAGAMRAFAEGAGAVTHLFNAMSGLRHRAPGLATAALDAPGATVGLIADRHHVAPAMVALAWRAARGRMCLVSDAMPTVGSAGEAFTLSGEVVRRRGGRLERADGRLAGADVALSDTLARAASFGVPTEAVLAAATSVPADLLGLADRGRLRLGARADMVVLEEDLRFAGAVPAR